MRSSNSMLLLLSLPTPTTCSSSSSSSSSSSLAARDPSTVHNPQVVGSLLGYNGKRRRRKACLVLPTTSPVHNYQDASMGKRRYCLRREVIFSTTGLFTGMYCMESGFSLASEFADMPALRGKDYGKTKMSYPDYTETQSGLQYKDLRVGNGVTPKMGQTVVVDWDGYTIGYYGRIFEARNKTKGGSFEGGDKDFYKFVIGSQQVIPAFEEAIAGMSVGGIRRIIVPPDIGYPDNDFTKKGPKPMTFSGQRALDFVLRNQGLIDKTLLFDIELIRIIPT